MRSTAQVRSGRENGEVETTKALRGKSAATRDPKGTGQPGGEGGNAPPIQEEAETRRSGKHIGIQGITSVNHYDEINPYDEVCRESFFDE